MKTLLFVFGTRPEAIKLAPVIINAGRKTRYFKVKVCVTAQHREMLDQVLDFFAIKPDYDLNLMQKNQSLFDITSRSLKALNNVLDNVKPDIICVQGDTTTVMTASLAAFYKKIKIAHIEAGLRSFEKFSPFPEEMNRVLTSHIADYHFCPTRNAKKNLEREGIKKGIYVTGNTVIDALFLGLKIIRSKGESEYKKQFDFIDFSKKIILVTCHRRESFGKPIEEIFKAILNIANSFNNVEIVYPVHFNPNVVKPAYRMLNQAKNIHLIKPLGYPDLIWLMNKSYLVLTDSGGIQEEAPSLGKPVLVLREVTERTEGIEAGTALLVGVNKNNIIRTAEKFLTDKKAYSKMARAVNPYGDGRSSERILKFLHAASD